MTAPMDHIHPLSTLRRIAVTAAVASALVPASALVAHAQTEEPPATATVTIVKDARPNSPRNFTFTTDLRRNNEHNLDNFTLDDDADPDRSNTEIFEGVVPGTYYVSEHEVDGWELGDIVCTGGDTTVDVADRRVTMTLAAGDEVTCTFLNDRVAQGGGATPIPTPSPTPVPIDPLPVDDGQDPVTVPAPIVAPTAVPAIENEDLPAALPRTGTGTGMLAGLGAALVATGTAVLRRSRRRVHATN